MAKQELTALKNILQQLDHVLSTTSPLPENRTPVCRELVTGAIAITRYLLKQSASPATTLGRKGGAVIAKRGSEYFCQLAAKRKAHRGGRPPKESA